MTRPSSRVHRLVNILGVTVLVVGGCGSAGEDASDCSDGKCDVPDSEVPPSPCDGLITDRSGAGHQKVAGRNNDFFAKLVLRPDGGCPTTVPEIMKKLRQTDTEGACASGEPGAGMRTTLVSETAEATGMPTQYRTVTSRVCGDRVQNDLMFSQFLSADDQTLPDDAEVISFDPTTFAFNFYKLHAGKFEFFGSSIDLLKGPLPDGTRDCATCHVGGGLIMKELRNPWMHWDERFHPMPGGQDLIGRIPDLGTRNNGEFFETVVRGGNEDWNQTRLKHLSAGPTPSLKALLEPLFCPVEINIANGSLNRSPVTGGTEEGGITAVPPNAMVDDQLEGFTEVTVQPADYDAVIKANKQRVEGVTGAIDTVFDYAFIERSGIDDDFVEKLKAAMIIDQDFVRDVLMVDFTRPVFSTDRCKLLDFAPEVSAPLTAQSIRDGFVANLQKSAPAAGTPAAVLLANLTNATDADQHVARVKVYSDACAALGSRAFLENALQIVSLNREKARDRPELEFPASLPRDNLMVHQDARLHPKTCKVVNTFVAP
jgi:hypothetical protein